MTNLHRSPVRWRTRERGERLRRLLKAYTSTPIVRFTARYTQQGLCIPTNLFRWHGTLF